MADAQKHLEQATRAAWLYYDRNLSQHDVAQRLAVSRATVSRLLTYARQTGIVQISLTRPLPEAAELEGRLSEHLPLTTVRVEPREPGETARQAAARGGARLFAELANTGQSIGVGWGTTIGAAAKLVPHRSAEGVTVVDVVGRPPGHEAFVAVSQILAHAWNVERLTIPAPAFAESAETRRALRDDPVVRDALDHARNADLIVLSIGGVDDSATLVEVDILSRSQIRKLRAAGAVGDLLSHFYDSDGVEVEAEGVVPPLGLGLSDLKRSKVVAIAATREKVRGISVAARCGLINGLVTDVETAKLLLRE